MINSLGLNDIIWWHRSWSTLAQVIACCLMAPSHYLNQCLLIIEIVLWHSSESKVLINLTRNIGSEGTLSKLLLHLLEANGLAVFYFPMLNSLRPGQNNNHFKDTIMNWSLCFTNFIFIQLSSRLICLYVRDILCLLECLILFTYILKGIKWPSDTTNKYCAIFKFLWLWMILIFF